MSASLHMGLVADKIATPEAAVKIVKPGQSVFIGTGCATPVGLGDGARGGGSLRRRTSS